MQHHYYTWGYLTLCRHWICLWVQCLMICLCEAHFTQRSCLQLLFVQLDVLGSCWLLHPGRFPVCQGGVNTARLHSGCDRLPVLHMLMAGRCQTWRCQLSWVSPPGFGQCWAAVTPIPGCWWGVCWWNSCASLQPEPSALGETSCWRWHFCIAYETNSWPLGAIY